MKVTIHYFAQLGALAGESERRLEIDAPCTAQELVTRLAADYGADFRAIAFDEGGDLAPSVLLFVDDRQVRWEEPAALAEGSSVLLATPVAGG